MTTPDAAPAASPTRCPLCDAPLDPAAPTECPKCDWVLGYRRQQEQTARGGSGRDMAAVFMSTLPGLGHIYKGHKLTGAILMAGTLLVALFVITTVTATALVSLLLLPTYWGGVMFHAYLAEDRAAQRTAVD